MIYGEKNEKNVDNMAQKPKLQDVLEVFLSKLETVKKMLGTYESVSSAIDTKIREIKDASVKVDLDPMKAVVAEIDQNVKKHIEDLKAFSNQYFKNLKQENQKSNQHHLYFYSSLTILFCLSFCFLWFGISQYYKKADAERKMDYYFREAALRNDFLKEEKLYQKYNDWINTEKSETQKGQDKRKNQK